MSRIGRKPVVVPANVKVSIVDQTIQIEGPKGKLSFSHRPEISLKYDDAKKQVEVSRCDDERLSRSLHGLTRSLVSNMVQGVSTGYTRKLEIVGVGYQAQLKKANTLALQVGYANQVVLEAPAGVTVTVPDPTHVTISGADKQAVGQFAASGPRGSAARTLQRKGNSLRGRSRPPQGRQGVRFQVITLPSTPGSGPDRSTRIASFFLLIVEDCPVDTANHHLLVQTRRRRRQHRVRKRLFGTTERPRLAVFRSSKHIYAQVINDQNATTLVSASTVDPEIKAQLKYGGNKAAATIVGRVVAERAKKAGIDKICFDRRSYKYHGRVEALAQAAREAGLQF